MKANLRVDWFLFWLRSSHVLEEMNDCSLQIDFAMEFNYLNVTLLCQKNFSPKNCMGFSKSTIRKILWAHVWISFPKCVKKRWSWEAWSVTMISLRMKIMLWLENSFYLHMTYLIGDVVGTKKINLCQVIKNNLI